MKWVVYPLNCIDMVDNERYDFLDQVFLRTPFYSFEDYALAKMPEVLVREDFRNALWLASPVFYRVLEKKDFDFGALQEKEKLTLYKYYNRMSFRPTPFGAFAAFSLTGWSAEGQVRLDAGANSILHLLPAMEWKAGPEAPTQADDMDLLLGANPTLYRLGDAWRYTRSVAEASGRLVFSLQGLAAEKLNNYLVHKTRKEPVSSAVLIEGLLNRSDCSPAEAADYVAFLVREEVLFSPHTPGLIEEKGCGAAGDLVSPWEWRGPLSLRLSESGRLFQLAERRRVAEPGGAATGSAPLFYAALERPWLKGGMDRQVQEQLEAVIAMLQKIVPQYPNRVLQEFKQAFKAKFESQRVPLLKALDPDAGISYGQLHRESGGQSMLEGLRFPVKGEGRSELEWSAVHRLFLRIWLGNGQRHAFDPVMIADEDLLDLQPTDPALQLPPSLAVLYSHAGGKLVLESIGGASATALTGRFSVFSPAVEALCRELAEAESAANPEVVFAEIHQRSHRHVDNINRRRPVYGHVIPLNVFPGAAGSLQIPPEDLLLSVRGDALVLESMGLGKRVVPRLPTAYNYHHNELSLFRLLCDLQFEGLRADLSFNPERLFPGMEYYPRIVYRDCIISLARWHLRTAELAGLTAKPSSLGRLHIFRQERGIPRHVSLGLSDQQLVFDLGDDGEALFFLACLKEAKTAVLREYLFPGDGVTSERKRLAGQGMALLKRNTAVYQGISPAATPVSPLPERTFLPGGEWLYVKIYCTPGSADRILLEVVLPVLDRYRTRIRGWFFIRYQDPETHLRIRFRTDGAGSGFLLEALGKKLAGGSHRELVREYRQDTYSRELERYSPELIESVEDFFCAGSEYILALKSAEINQEAGAGEMEPFNLVWEMCRLFIADLAVLALFLDRSGSRFLNEFKADDQLLSDLDQRYRRYSGSLRTALEEKRDPGSGSAYWELMMDKLSGLATATTHWPVPQRENLLADLVHMQLNRLFASRQREHEGMIYHHLHKYAVSLAARSRRN
jgi:thiopeptide-type bacteriocin biosynthesis protein